jgi:hypothetical protein
MEGALVMDDCSFNDAQLKSPRSHPSFVSARPGNPARAGSRCRN